MQQDGKTVVRDKRVRPITCMFVRDLHLILMFSGLYKKICLQESEVWRKVISKLFHKVCRLVSSPLLFRKFTILSGTLRNYDGDGNVKRQ